MVFPEINPDKFSRPQGMNITFVTTAKSDDDARDFLLAMGMPIKKDSDEGGSAA
jgi:large subunit ribosomal protein L5